MIFQDLSFDLPEKNISYDDELLRLAETDQGSEVLRFWESREVFIVLGRICKEEDDVNLEEAKKEDISILRRSSGGGTVLQGKGCLNYTLILSKDCPEIADLRQSYLFILTKVVNALEKLGVKAVFYPISDIALVDGKKKISGNAQRRGRKFILHHGTILYDFDLSLISKYLKMPKDKPEYRFDRTHLDFVANVEVPSEDIKEELKQVFL